MNRDLYQILSKSSICILSLSFFFIWGKTKREELGWYGRSRIYLYSKQFLNSYRESQWFSGGHCTKCYYIPKSWVPTPNHHHHHHHHLTLLNMAKKGQNVLVCYNPATCITKRLKIVKMEEAL